MIKYCIMLILLCLSPLLYAESIYDINDYRSNNDKLCRGWRFSLLNQNAPELLNLTHYAFDAHAARDILIAPDLTWWYEVQSPTAYGQSDELETLQILLMNKRSVALRHRNGRMGLARSTRWLNKPQYDLLEATEGIWAFKQGKQVGLLDDAGRQIMRIKGEAIQSLGKQLAIVKTVAGEGVWSITKGSWLIRPAATLQFERQEHLLLSKRGQRMAFVDQIGGRISDTAYDAVEPLPGAQYVLVSNKGLVEVVDSNGYHWLSPEGLPPQAQREAHAESLTAPRALPQLPFFVNHGPSIRIMGEQIFVWQKDRWRIFSLRNGNLLDEFNDIEFSRTRSDSTVFWARKGPLQGYFEVKGGPSPLLQETLFGAPDDFDYPLWSLVRESDGWVLHQSTAPNHLHFVDRRHEAGSSRHPHSTDQVYLLQEQGREERWGICSTGKTWQKEQQCLANRLERANEKDEAQILRAAGLHDVLKPELSKRGQVQIAFPGGALTAVHENCWLDQPVLVCSSSTDRESLIPFGANPADEHRRAGTSHLYTVYQLSDGKNMTPAGAMKTQPMTRPGEYVEMKSTEGIHWTSLARKTSYRLDCTEGSPVLSGSGHFPLWRWQVRAPGFHGNVDPALKRIMGELHRYPLR